MTHHYCQRSDRQHGAVRRGVLTEHRSAPTPTAVIAAEPASSYDAGHLSGDTGQRPDPGSGPDLAEPRGGDDAGSQAIAQLLDIAQMVARLDLDALSDAQAERCLDELRRPLAILEAARSRMLADQEARAARRVRPGRNTRGAKDEQRRRSAKRQHMSRSRAKRGAEAGHAAQEHQATGAAFARGDIGPEHVRLIADLLKLVPVSQRAEVEAQLLALARDHEPVSFGRRARELLHHIAPADSADAEGRQESQRELRIADTPDGSLALSGRLSGTSAELARVALDAFRRFDTPDEQRTVEQRNADAFLQLCEVALRSEQAPAQHGARPHVLVIVRAEDLVGGAGPARFGFSGQPVNLVQARRLFSDAIVSRIAFTANGTPIEASAGVRTVPAGLHRALVARDGGCTWDGCDAPPSWCDVAHGNVPFRENQPLRVGDAALLCRRHHRRFDQGSYRMEIEGGRVSYRWDGPDERSPGEHRAGSHGPDNASHPTGRNSAAGETGSVRDPATRRPGEPPGAAAPTAAPPFEDHVGSVAESTSEPPEATTPQAKTSQATGPQQAKTPQATGPPQATGSWQATGSRQATTPHSETSRVQAELFSLDRT